MHDSNDGRLWLPPIADIHVHLRQILAQLLGKKFGMVIPQPKLVEYSVAGGAYILGPMLNTAPALTKPEDVLRYHEHIEHPGIEGTVRIATLTPETTADDIRELVAQRILDGKWYPKYRTTNSEAPHGIERYSPLLSVAKVAAELGFRFHFHPEVPSQAFGNRDAEWHFLSIARMFLETGVTVVWEHGTDGRCVPEWKQFAREFPGQFYLTLTAHHLATNEDESFGDVRMICKPPIKTEADRLALVALVKEDHPWVMAGSDSAPHPKSAKHTDTGGCACGDFTAPFLYGLYAHALTDLLEGSKEEVGTFVNFTSGNAKRLYGLPEPKWLVEVFKEPFQIPLFYAGETEPIMPALAGKTIDWSWKTPFSIPV